jgi:hypothetical protein
VVAAVASLWLSPVELPEAGAASDASPARCGTADLPETGIQGDVPRADQASGRAEQGYNCGLALVGHHPLTAGGRDTGNANMAWAGDCAYVAGAGSVFGRGTPSPSGGVAVVDVRDPARPRHRATLQSPGAALALETIHAVETPERSILVVGEYGNQSGGGKPMDVYDVTDCARPRLLETFSWPANIHNLTISGDGRYVFATQPLQVADLAPLFDDDPATGVRYVGNLERATPYPLVPVAPGPDLDDGLPAEVRELAQAIYLAHEVWPTHDGTKLYLGGQLPTFEVFTIVDVADWLAGAGPPRVISQRSGRGHSVRTATIGGVPYVVHSEESPFGTAYGCVPERLNPFAGPAEAWLTNIADETDPVTVSQLELAINDPARCADQLASGVQASVHYQDVDDPADTRFVAASMYNAGVRLFDVRDPVRPVEVAYFNPGDVAPGGEVDLDQAWGHVRWVPETGHLWFATQSGGFWVVELEPQVRQALALPGPAPGVRHPQGRPARSGLAVPRIPADPTSAVYCTIAPLG